jgi:hypothetical protein
MALAERAAELWNGALDTTVRRYGDTAISIVRLEPTASPLETEDFELDRRVAVDEQGEAAQAGGVRA